ncbi:MAG: BatD family protein, partial [Opitutaceae bacterium]|nr:BatD family protein [Opitutaceae bacterium]
MRLVSPHFLFLCLLMIAGLARAQSVRWVPAESGVSQAALLVFEDCAPDGEPQLPAVAGVTFTRAGESSNTSIINGTVSRSIVLNYLIRARQSGPVAIPAFTVRTDKGPQRVAAFTVGAPAAPVDSFASARLLPERASVWAGEVFGLTYELSASRRTNPQIQPTFDWNAAPLVAEDWSKPEINDAVTGGDRRVVVGFRTRA